MEPRLYLVGFLNSKFNLYANTNISGGDFSGGPNSKIEILDLAGTNIYTNIYKNSEVGIIPEFEISESKPLKAIVELFDASPVADAELELFLQEQDPAIHYYIFWLGAFSFLLSLCALLILRKRRLQWFTYQITLLFQSLYNPRRIVQKAFLYGALSSHGAFGFDFAGYPNTI